MLFSASGVRPACAVVTSAVCSLPRLSHANDMCGRGVGSRSIESWKLTGENAMSAPITTNFKFKVII